MTGTGTQKRWNNYFLIPEEKGNENELEQYKESFSSIKALKMILFTQGVTYLPLSHVAAQVLSIFKIKHGSLFVYMVSIQDLISRRGNEF